MQDNLMEVLKRWTEFSAKAAQTDPSYYYGKENSAPFIYDSATLIYAKSYKSKTGIFKNKNFIDFINDEVGNVIHSEIAEVVGDVNKLKSLNRVVHGRTNPLANGANLMMSLSSLKGKDEKNEIRQIVRTLKRYKLLKNEELYTIGVFKDTEWVFYIVTDEELKGQPPQKLSTHKIMRDRIYNKLGLESVETFFALLREEL